jgi:hypothetical protein
MMECSSFPALFSDLTWLLAVIHGRSIYTMKIAKCCKSEPDVLFCGLFVIKNVMKNMLMQIKLKSKLNA